MTGEAVTDIFVKHHLVFIVKRKWLVLLELPCKRRVEAETQSRSCFAAAHLHFLQLQFTAANNHGAARPWLCHCLIECVYTWVSEAPGGNQPPNPADVSATEPHRTTSLLKNHHTHFYCISHVFVQMLHSFFLMFLCLTLLHCVTDLLTLYGNIAYKIHCLLEH